jgi:alkylhydroperoxidase/carboxymuconolactone decarboxylase family protein YurZ
MSGATDDSPEFSPVRGILNYDLDPAHARYNASPLSGPLRDLVNGPLQDLWTRTDELPLKTKCLINVATLAALGRAQLRQHVQAALRNGNTPQEIAAVFQHTALYAGVPLAIDGMLLLVELTEGHPDAPADGALGG